MPLVAVTLERPSFDPVGLPIYTLAEYEVNRDLNAAGTWSLAFPCTERLAGQVRARWRVSLIEEGRSGYLLRRGIVTGRTFRVAPDGSGVLALQGFSRLYGLVAESTHQGLAFDGTADIQDISEALAGEAVTVPAGASSRKPKVTFNDTSKLAAWLSALELVRYNLRETFDEDGWELVEQDNVPDSGFSFVTADYAGADLAGAAAAGLGLIADAPTIGHDGSSLATRIIPVGVDWDGKPLTLQYSTKTTPYVIHTRANPDGSNHYYLQDGEAESEGEVIELPFVRSDVKNPSNDAGTREAAANVLYALAAGELLKRRVEIISFGSTIANGDDIDALPGSRVRVRFRGIARTPWGSESWEDLDRDFLIAKRRDAGSIAGVRQVSFTLTAQETPFFIPSLPEAVPIPPSPTEPPDPPRPNDPNDPFNPIDPSLPPFESPPFDPFPGDLPPGPGLPADLDALKRGRGAYQPCCGDPTTDVEDGAEDPPEISLDPPEPPVEGDLTAKVWYFDDPLPEDAVLFLYVGSTWNDPSGSEESHSLSGGDVAISALADYETAVAWQSGVLVHIRTHHYFYKVKVTGASPSLSLNTEGLGNVSGYGYVFYGTPTVDIASFTSVTVSFVKAQTGVSLSISRGGDVAAFIYGRDWAAADAISVSGFPQGGSISHDPFTDDGWTADPRTGSTSSNGTASAGHKAGGGTATVTFDANIGTQMSLTTPSEVSVAAVAVIA